VVQNVMVSTCGTLGKGGGILIQGSRARATAAATHFIDNIAQGGGHAVWQTDR
jgi:hypothetical protein